MVTQREPEIPDLLPLSKIEKFTENFPNILWERQLEKESHLQKIPLFPITGG